MPLTACHSTAKPNYERHEPHKNVLYQTIEQYWESFVKKCEAYEHPVPGFIKKEF